MGSDPVGPDDAETLSWKHALDGARAQITKLEEELRQARRTNAYLAGTAAATNVTYSPTLAWIIHQAFGNSLNHGFWDKGRTPEACNLSERLALMHSEISEALEEYRAGRPPSEIYFVKDKDGLDKPEGFTVELADVILRIGDSIGGLGLIDKLHEALRLKMEYNEKRPRMHGGKKF